MDNKKYKEKFTEQVVAELLKDYTEGMSLKELKSKYHAGSDTIYKLIDKNNIPRINKKDLSKFKNLQDSELQYWIGYICADGNIQYNTEKRVYSVSLYSKDEEVVLNFKKYFGDIVNLYYRKDSNMKQAYINSKELCEYFINELNIVPNKAFCLNPSIEYTSNFILGYFDGDGCIRNSTESTTRYEAKFTSGTKSFLEKIKQILDSENIYSIIRQKENTYDLCIERKSDSEKLYKFLYKDKVVCLTRKLNNFVALFGNIEE